jgi:methylmalonyl-CoA mutase
MVAHDVALKESAGRKTRKAKSKHKVRFVTAASLFDGHDASINIIRRLLQSAGAEVVHLGHNRSVNEVVTAALHEDADATTARSTRWSPRRCTRMPTPSP